MTTYGDLPTHPDGTVLHCPTCTATYSADHGDYFWAQADDPIICAECGDPMELGRMVTTFVPVEAAS